MKVRKKLVLSITLAIFLVGFFTSVSGALDARAPTVTNLNPGSDATVTSTDFKLSFTVTDVDDNIQNANYFIKLDEVALPATLVYKGHWVTDYWDGDYWVIDSYQEATVSTNVSGMKDGVHSAELKAMDNSGNILNQAWQFTVAVKPVFSNFAPGKDVKTKDNKGFSLKVTDNDAINPQSIKAELDGTPVDVGFDANTGVVSYGSVIPDGTHKVKVTAADPAGNTASTEWPFTVQTVGPDLTFAGSEQTYKTYQPTISVNLKSNVTLSNTGTVMQIDGQQVAANFCYLGHFVINYSGANFIVDSYNEGTISFTAQGLTDGTHQVTVIAKDELGNQSSKSWSFNVAQPPLFSGLEPANGSITAIKPVVKAIILDPSGSVDPNSISLTIDNNKVIPELTNSNGTVTLTYSSDSLASDSYHNVTLAAADSAGNSATTSWKFFASAIGQSTGFSRQTPADQSDTASIAISVHLTDLNRTYEFANVSLRIDNGTAVKPTVIGKDTEFLLSYTPQTLTDGKHTVTVTVPSLTAGASPLTTTWSFTVNIPPVITKPSPTYTVISSTPVLSAYARDNSGIASAKFTVDDQTFNGAIDPRFNRVSVKLPTALSTGSHDATLSVLDTAGNEAIAQWKFSVDTNTGAIYPDMPIATNNTCWQCHQKEYNFGHAAPTQCLRCHTAKVTSQTEFRDCTGCHFGSTYITNRHAYDSTWVWDNLPNRRHTVNDNHLSTSVQCTECHSRILTQEHNRPDRKDKNGNPITCDTCHTNTYLATVSSDEATKVKQAISTKATDCTACHEQAGHASIHTSGLEAKCASAGCHNGNLQSEHQNNITTSGKGYTCNTCHANTNSDVGRAIRNNQLSCSNCHSTAHGVPLGETLPADIPLYQGFTFSRPIVGAIFAGDQGLPAGYDLNYKAGAVVISDRIPVNPSDVWNFYKTQLVTKGWALKTNEPGAITTNFSAEFEKYGRLLTVRCYKTTFGDGSGSQYSGFRLEIWYK
jgi:hypothetical protein